MHNREKGFSLIELLIVVAIILIIAAIAIPNLLRSRMAAAQASAVGSIHAINTSAIAYDAIYGNGYPPSLAALGSNGTSTATCTNAGLIDPVLTGGTKQGYTFVLTKGQVQVTSATSSCSAGYGYADGYMITATPITVGTTGQISYCSDPSSVIRFNSTGATNPGPSPSCAMTDAALQ